MRKCRRLLADFNKSKTSVSFSDIVLPRTLICTCINNGLQKSLLKLKILKKYDKTRDEVFSTIPLQTIACSLELNIQNQTSLVPPARKQKFSSFFLRQHHARYLHNKRGQFDPYPEGENLPAILKTDFAATYWAPCAHRERFIRFLLFTPCTHWWFT